MLEKSLEKKWALLPKRGDEIVADPVPSMTNLH